MLGHGVPRTRRRHPFDGLPGSTDLASYGYWYDKASSPTKQQFLTRSGDPSSEYEYDTLNRLTYALYFDAASNGTSQWLYDDVDNRTYHVDRSANAITYYHNVVNEYTKIGTTARSHDAAGNLIDDGTYTYQWDYQGRLTRIERKSDSGTVALLDYDALSRRVAKYDSVAASTGRFYYADDADAQLDVRSPGWGEWHCIEEYDTSGTPARQRYYVYGPAEMDELLCLNNDVGDNTGTFYALHDHLYSVVALVDTNGSAVERYKYNAYGNVLFQDGSFNDLDPQTSAYGNPFTFTGRRLDQMDDLDLELFYQGARYRGPTHGRFLSDGPSGYTYVGASPSGRRDARGRGGGVRAPANPVTSSAPRTGGQECNPSNWPGAGNVADCCGNVFPDHPSFLAGTPARRSAQQCCGDARSIRVRNSPLPELSGGGASLCCDGRRVSCTWSDGVRANMRGEGIAVAPGSSLLAIAVQCSMAHEQRHCRHTSGSSCPQECEITVRQAPNERARKREECQALKVEVRCLLNSDGACGRDAVCKRDLLAWMVKRRARRDRYCNAVGGRRRQQPRPN